MEHAVFGLPVDGSSVFKATKGTKFGFYPHCPPNVVSSRPDELFEMRPATPAQYLVRLIEWDAISPRLNRFIGFTRLDGCFSIVTSQTWFEARNATWKEIGDFLDGLGFVPVRADVYENATTWYHPAQNLALFDVGSSNLIWSAGHLVPIDIIPVRPADHMREILRQFVHAD